MGSLSYDRPFKKLSKHHVAVFNGIPSWGSHFCQPDHNKHWDVCTSYSRIEKSQHGLVWTWQKRLACKFIANIFWESQGVLLTYFIPKGVNMNSVYYCKILCELKADICHKRSNLKNEQIFIYLHDNGHLHSSEFTTTFLGFYNSIPRWAWMVYFSTSGLFAWSGTQWFIHVSQRFPGCPAFCRWFTGERSSCKIFLWLSNEPLCYGNWKSCRSIWKNLNSLVIMLKNRLSHIVFIYTFIFTAIGGHSSALYGRDLYFWNDLRRKL